MFELENYLKEIYQTDNINICTENNDLLCPNIKLIELILLNPQKFKKLKIVNNIYKLNSNQTNNNNNLYVPSTASKITKTPSTEKIYTYHKKINEINNFDSSFDDINDNNNKPLLNNTHTNNNLNLEIKTTGKKMFRQYSNPDLKFENFTTTNKKYLENNSHYKQINKNLDFYDMKKYSLNNNNNINNKQIKYEKYKTSKYVNTRNSDDFSLNNSTQRYEKKYMRDYDNIENAIKQKPGELFNTHHHYHHHHNNENKNYNENNRNKYLYDNQSSSEERNEDNNILNYSREINDLNYNYQNPKN